MLQSDNGWKNNRGIIVTISGKSYGRIDRIFVEPVYQGKGIGSYVIKLIEEEYPSIRIWDLETSSRQLNNHHFIKRWAMKLFLSLKMSIVM